MSTEIKPGQIWAWNSALPHEGGLVVTKTEGDNVHYRYEDESIAGEHHRDTEHFTERAHLVTDTTPAPLDPSKALSFEGYKAPITALDPTAVRAGDTVTLEREQASITDEVRQVGHMQSGATLLHLVGVGGPWAIHGGAIGWTLAAHTPAPEPEPATSEVGDAIRELKHVVRTEDEIEGIALQVDDLWNRAQQHRECRPLPTWAEIHNTLAANLPADIDSLRKMTNDVEALLRGESR